VVHCYRCRFGRTVGCLSAENAWMERDCAGSAAEGGRQGLFLPIQTGSKIGLVTGRGVDWRTSQGHPEALCRIRLEASTPPVRLFLLEWGRGPFTDFQARRLVFFHESPQDP